MRIRDNSIQGTQVIFYASHHYGGRGRATIM